MRFASREEAGRELGQFLIRAEVHADAVLGLPRGGVVVAAEVARVLRLPLDALVVRKIGHPFHREFAIGALAENDVLTMDDSSIVGNAVLRADLDLIIAEERKRLENYQVRFHPRPPIDLKGKRVLVVDDGLATGATTLAAIISVRKQGASRVVVSAPVASTHAYERLSREADDARVLLVDPGFDSVGRYYQEFTQTTDDQVVELLRAA